MNYLVTRIRHYAQQYEYTICRGKADGRYVYSNHETAFEGALTKCTLPVNERRKALKQLQRMNVTAFSLFGNEESLMETLPTKKSRRID